MGSMSQPELWMYCTGNETKLIDEHMYRTMYLVSSIHT